MQIGLVGLPNAGKTTLFNGLTKLKAATAPFPFTTIDKNVGVVAIPDKQLEQLALTLKIPKVTPATIRFVDIAGLVKGASKGEGLGNQFLSHIREVAAIAHVVRCFPQSHIPLATSKLDPKEAIEIINYELLLADLATVEKQSLKLAKLVKAGQKEAQKSYRQLQLLAEQLQLGKTALTWPYISEWKNLNLLTAKPVIYVANISYDRPESLKLAKEVKEYASAQQADFVMLDSEIEFELSEVEDEQLHAELKTSYGLQELGLEQLIKAAARLLNLITFYTIVGSECKAWVVKKGTTALQAAAQIHTDIAKGFIKAEVLHLSDWQEQPNLAKLKEAGRIHIEGQDYQLQNGDILTIKFRGM